MVGRKAENIKNNRYGNLVAVNYMGNSMWICECDCGSDRLVRIGDLKSGKITNCSRCNNKIAAHKDIRDQVFGHLKVLDYVGESKWLCKCDCNKLTIARGSDLKSGKVISCGHVSKTGKLVDITDMHFNKWTVLKYAGNRKWLCRCSCGREKEVWAKFLKNGKSKSCGHSIIDERLGDTFGDLKVIGREDSYRWICECNCGNKVVVGGQNLLSGRTKSCGCKAADVPKYTKQDIVSIIEKLKIELGRKPYFYELVERLEVVESTAYNYLSKHKLSDSIEHPKGSNYEVELIKILSKKFDNIDMHNREILRGRELDIYIPEKKLDIEFNGTFWHCSNQKYKNYHQDKTIDCAKQGIQLIHIFEYEWKDQLTKNKLINIILNDTKKIGASKTYVREIDTNVEKDFLNTYHLSGYAPSSIKLGCFNKETQELLGVMTFGSPRFNSKYEYEIIRLCWRDDTQVIGGLNKLFKYFLNKYNPSSIITYSDISKFTGNSYCKIGFKPSENCITEPNYKWVSLNSDIVFTRYQTQKQKLIDRGLGTVNQTEDEIMEQLNFVKVFDSGNILLEWFNSSSCNK